MYAIAYLVWTSVWKFLLSTSFVCFTVYEKLKTCFDSILKVGGQRANCNGPCCIVLLHWYYQGLAPYRSSQVDHDSLPSCFVSKRLCTCFEPFEPYNNTAEEANVQSRWALCPGHIGQQSLPMALTALAPESTVSPLGSERLIFIPSILIRPPQMAHQENHENQTAALSGQWN